MGWREFLALAGGLALFLHGMELLGGGLKTVAAGKMRQFLEHFTASPLTGVLTGTIVTAVIQSSSATTVMVAGLADAGMMTPGPPGGLWEQTSGRRLRGSWLRFMRMSWLRLWRLRE